jgi:p-hydroxybenzoate 3-monooxygenase
MTQTQHVPVVIIGAGVAGLTLANLLQRNGIRSTVLEKHPREYVEQRQRAGTIDTRGVRMFREWGLAEVLEGTPIADSAGGFYIDGHAMPINVDDDDESVFCPQQVLVRNLADTLLRADGDIRYNATDVRLTGLETETPTVAYRDTNGSITTLDGRYIAGCDGDRGISRASIPPDVLTRYSHEYGYAWLSVLAEASAPPSGMAIHSRGLAGIIPPGSSASRLYLQIPLTDTIADWTDDRIWTELEVRFGTAPSAGLIIDKQIVLLRSSAPTCGYVPRPSITR